MTSQKAKILLVDDEPKNLIALASILESEDRVLTLAASGEEALRYLLRDDYAVILLDILMPGMDGFETAELVRERDRTKDTPIIFLTAAVRGEFSAAKGYALGGVDYITKPFNPDMLRAKVAVFVELHKKTKQVEQQAKRLAETSALLQGILDGSTEHAIMALDSSFRFVEWNEGAALLYGYSREEMLRKSAIGALYEAGSLASIVFESLFARADKEWSAEGETESRRSNGSVFPAWVSVTLRKDSTGDSRGYVVIVKDITDLKRAEQSRIDLLRETAARLEAESARRELQQIVDLLPEAILIVDEHANIRLQNRRAADLMIPVKPGAGTQNSRSHRTSQPYETPVPDELLALARSLVTEGPIAGQRLVLHPQYVDRKIPVLVNGEPISDSTGVVKGGVLSVQDISPIAEFEEQKDAFLSSIAHDLRTPLTVIIGKAQILERRAQRLDGEEGELFGDLAGSIVRSSKRAASLVNGLLDNARLGMDSRLELNREEVNLQELLNEMIAELSLISDRHELRLFLAKKPIIGSWDRERISRVVNNLVTNAVKYTPEGGIISLCCLMQDEEAIVQVSDTGIGIPRGDQERIFELFFRAGNAVERFDGVGIGLFGARKIVETHGGAILLDSEEGKGSTFTVRLPLKSV